MDRSQPLARRAVAAADVRTRADFLFRTYAHLFGAITVFTVIEAVLFETGVAWTMARAMLGAPWLLILGAFMIVGWFASRTAHAARSLPAQYLALGAFVVAEAVIFVPLLVMADSAAPGAIRSAATITLVGFAGLTAVVFLTRKDFSFLRGVLGWAMISALLLIVGSAIFGWNLGTWFSVGMVAVAGASVLYDTSKILLHYPEDKAVAASLELFASIALLFWYVLRLTSRR